MDAPAKPGWWVINGEVILDALRRTHNGEDPDIVMLELYLGCDHETIDGN